MRILVQRYNWAIFLRKWARRVNGDRYRATLNEFLFSKIEEEDICNMWFQQDGAMCHTAEATLDVFAPYFWRSHYQPQRMMGHRKPACIHWKPDASKTNHCLVGILVQRHNWVIFLRKWARRVRHNQWRPLSFQVEQVFVHKNWRREYGQHLFATDGTTCHTAEATIDVFAPYFWRSHYQP